MTSELKLARGLLFHGENVLLVRDIRPGEGHYFVPGGKVEPQESVKEALKREWEEELGWQVQVDLFIGCVEHAWTYDRKSDSQPVNVLEINFIFLIHATPEVIDQIPQSKESHLEFSWVPVSHLKEIRLLPVPMETVIEQVHTGTHGTAIWSSTL